MARTEESHNLLDLTQQHNWLKTPISDPSTAQNFPNSSQYNNPEVIPNAKGSTKG